MAQRKNGRGFSALDPEKRRNISSAGGRAAHESGHAHEWNSAEAKEAGRRGGLAAHHHQRAAFHHETAAHHHQRAAVQHAAGNRNQAELHAETAHGHERRAGQHAEEAFRHGQVNDDNERRSESSPDEPRRSPRSDDEPSERRAGSGEAYEDQIEPSRTLGPSTERDTAADQRSSAELLDNRSGESANESVENGASERSEARGTAREAI